MFNPFMFIAPWSYLNADLRTNWNYLRQQLRQYLRQYLLQYLHYGNVWEQFVDDVCFIL